MTCDCPPSEPYWQLAIDGTQTRITETIHRLGCETGREIAEGANE